MKTKHLVTALTVATPAIAFGYSESDSAATTPTNSQVVVPPLLPQQLLALTPEDKLAIAGERIPAPTITSSGSQSPQAATCGPNGGCFPCPTDIEQCGPPPEPGDAPLPIWALGMLGSGLIGSIARRSRERNK